MRWFRSIKWRAAKVKQIDRLRRLRGLLGRLSVGIHVEVKEASVAVVLGTTLLMSRLGLLDLELGLASVTIVSGLVLTTLILPLEAIEAQTSLALLVRVAACRALRMRPWSARLRPIAIEVKCVLLLGWLTAVVLEDFAFSRSDTLPAGGHVATLLLLIRVRAGHRLRTSRIEVEACWSRIGPRLLDLKRELVALSRWCRGHASLVE